MRNILLAGVAAGALAIAAYPASAAVVVLDFEGVNSSYPSSNWAHVLDFYNGGTSSQGTSGTDYGVSLPDNALALCLNTVGVTCSNTSRGGLGDPTSQQGGLFFLAGSNTYVNVAAGFDTGFSFFYSAINQGGTVNVWSGENGTGTLLASLVLPTTASNCGVNYNAGFCPFVAAGISFSGIAKSIDFGGVANQIVFDDVTFGSATPGTVPEPASLALFGAGLAGLATMRRRRRTA